MSYHPQGLTPEQEDQLLASVRELQTFSERESRARKIALAAGIAGAIFAAVRLGFVVIPRFRLKGKRVKMK